MRAPPAIAPRMPAPRPSRGPSAYVQGAGVTALCLAWWACFLPAGAQTGPAPDNTELAKQSENPVTRLYTVPLRYEGGYDYGPTDGTRSILELDQAVVPFRLSDDWSLITRTKLPAQALPPKRAGDSWADGLSNGYTTFFLSPEHGRGFYWGAGPVLYYPATNSMLGATKWGSGPSLAFIHEDAGPWVFALVANNIWTFGRATGNNRHQPNAAQPDHRQSFR